MNSNPTPSQKELLFNNPTRDPASEARDEPAEVKPMPDALNVAISINLFELLGDPDDEPAADAMIASRS